MVIGFLARLGHDFDVAIAHRIQRRADDFGGFHEPLVCQHRFNDDLGTVAKGLHDLFRFDQWGRIICAFGIRFDRFSAQTGIRSGCHDGEAFGSDLIHNQFAGLEPVQSAQVIGHKVDGVGCGHIQRFLTFGDGQRKRGFVCIRRTIGAQGTFGVHQAVHGDAAAFGDLVIVEIMRAGDFHRARAEIGIGVFVGDDRDQTTVFFGPNRNFAQLTHDGRIACIRRMHRNCAVAQHRFGAGCRDRDIVAGFVQRHVPVFVFFDVFIGRTTRERVFKVPHIAVDFDVFDFKIRDGSFKLRIPVDQPFTAIDQVVVVHLNKNFDDGIVEILLPGFRITGRTTHGKSFAGPIAGCAQPFQLADDGAARFDLLLPDTVDEFFAPHLCARRLAVGRHFAFGHHLRGDTGVVCARLPKCVEPAHPVPTHQNVLQRVIERVPHMQAARHIGGGDHDAICAGTRFRVCACFEAAALFPCLIQAGFGFGGVKGLFHRHRVGPAAQRSRACSALWPA